MKNLFPKVVAFAVVVVFGVSLLLARGQSSSQSAQTSAKPPDLDTLLKKTSRHSARPMLGEYSELPVENQRDHDRRRVRETLYRLFFHGPIIDPGSKVVNGQAETVSLTLIDSVTVLEPGEIPDPPGLPVRCMAIVIGTIVGGKVFVSEDRDLVYSDYRTRVTAVLKQDSQRAIPQDGEIITWRSGGSLRFPSGHIKHFIIAGEGFPEIGSEYVFFLWRGDPRLDEYSIVTAYQLRNGVVLPLDGAGADGVYSLFESKSRADFLTLLQKAIGRQKLSRAQ